MPFNAGTDPNDLTPSALMGGTLAGDEDIVAELSSIDPKVTGSREKNEGSDTRRREDVAELGFHAVPSARKRRRSDPLGRQRTELILNEARHTLFRGTDVTTRGNVNPVLYGDTFLTEGTRPPGMSLHGRVCCILLGRQSGGLRSCRGRRSRGYSR